MRLRHLLVSASVVVITMTSATKDNFTPLEQQQISIETAGLFERSNAFTVDFAGLRTGDYCFPLPVGKAKLLKDNTLEITTKKGDAVKAMFAGTVRLSKRHGSQGNVIVVRHDNGLETVYGHNAQNLVKVGQRVSAGQTIAIVGSEGGRTYCSFSVMVNGGRINPGTILSIDSHRLLRQTIMCKKSGGLVSLSVIQPDKEEKALADNGKHKSGVDFDANLFAGGNKFTLNLADLGPRDWCYPLPDSKVISNYGRRGRRSHTGVDIKTRPNDNILAAFDGVVTMSQKYYAYGNCIRIKHANGLETLYSHNSKNLVKVGDRVKAGQVIALTGRTGRATTEHLHFECRVNGRPFDPAKIFDHRNHSIRMEQLTFTKSRGGISIKSDRNYMAKGR